MAVPTQDSTPQGLDALQAALGYQFSNARLLHLALTPSTGDNENNQRLEFLGDSVIGFVVAYELYERFPHQDEGFLTRARMHLINRRFLAERAREIQLGRCLRLRAEDQRAGKANLDSALSDAYEAVVGAILLDAGFQTVRDCIRRLLGQHLEAVASSPPPADPKSRLQEVLQSVPTTLPIVEEDVVDLQALATRIREPRREIDLYLAGFLGTEESATLATSAGQNGPREPLLTVVLAVLNAACASKSLLNPRNRGGINFREETAGLLRRRSPDEAVPRLHRLFLEDAFPRELARKPHAPNYRVLQTYGPVHQREYQCAVYHRGAELARGRGRSKKEAEANAALDALRRLPVPPPPPADPSGDAKDRPAPVPALTAVLPKERAPDPPAPPTPC